VYETTDPLPEYNFSFVLGSVTTDYTILYEIHTASNKKIFSWEGDLNDLTLVNYTYSKTFLLNQGGKGDGVVRIRI